MNQILNTCDLEYLIDEKGKPEWEQAMWHEIDSLDKNHTWELVPQPQGRNIVRCWWVYWTSFTSKGVIEHHKDHLVAKDLFDQEGINYTETFSPIAKMNSC